MIKVETIHRLNTLNAQPNEKVRPFPVIFSDLDGTLLDRKTYSFEHAGPALRFLKGNSIPLILCSSKTRGEIEHYRNLLGINDPFVVENGGAVYIPKDYFSFGFDHNGETEEYFIIKLGTTYSIILENLQSLKEETGIPIKGFSEMSDEEIVSLCDISIEQARLAKQREFDEPFILMYPEHSSQLEKAIKFPYTKGDRFYHITDTDKGEAAAILIDLFTRNYGEILSIGIGNSINDLPLLSKVDIPIFFQSEKTNSKLGVTLPFLPQSEKGGPESWNYTILNHLRSHLTATEL